MTDYHRDKAEKIHGILSIVKLGSILFLGLMVLNTFFENKNLVFYTENSYYNFSGSTLTILSIALLYAIWTFVIIKRLRGKQLIGANIIEGLVLLLIFSALIIISGGNESDYKYAFLFIIISCTIQLGMWFGIGIAILASAFIIGMDLIVIPGNLGNAQLSNDIMICAIFFFTAWPLGYYVKLENEHIMALEDFANRDGLTGLNNHRYFHEQLKRIFKDSLITDKTFSLIFMDVDYFKEYNDCLGHQQGDNVLREIGTLLRELCDDEIIVARYGGDEFAAIVEDTKKIDVYELSEKIRKTIETAEFIGEKNLTFRKLTMSIGIALSNNKMRNETELIKYVDDALYRAKFYNKNRVEIYSSVFEALKIDIEESHIDLITSIKTLISVINSKDKYTYGHVERVVMYVKSLADELGLSEENKKILVYGAYMHDVGKINIDQYILNKKTPLTKEEWEIIQKHPVEGVSIIQPIGILLDTVPLIMHHHERYDGKGYPDGLKGEEIPYLTRILTVADSFDAMTSSRPYSTINSFQEGILELRRCSGIQFDPQIVNDFVNMIENKWDMVDSGSQSFIETSYSKKKKSLEISD